MSILYTVQLIVILVSVFLLNVMAPLWQNQDEVKKLENLNSGKSRLQRVDPSRRSLTTGVQCYKTFFAI